MKKTLFILLLAAVASGATGQRIHYSDVDRDDYRQMIFDIIGKVSGKTHVYKNSKNRNEISVFDGEM